MAKKKSACPAGYRDRIKEHRRVPASSIKPHPENFRVHGKEQAAAMVGVLTEVGI